MGDFLCACSDRTFKLSVLKFVCSPARLGPHAHVRVCTCTQLVQNVATRDKEVNPLLTFRPCPDVGCAQGPEALESSGEAKPYPSLTMKKALGPSERRPMKKLSTSGHVMAIEAESAMF